MQPLSSTPRFNGFWRRLETAKTVEVLYQRKLTPLKRGVNERGVTAGRRVRQMVGLNPAILTALCVLTSCSSFRTEMGHPLVIKTNEFAEGITRVDTVLHELGPPHQVSRLSDGFVFLYEYSAISEFQFGLSANLPIVRWFKFVKAWNHLDQDSLILTFDDQGVLQSAGSDDWKESLGGGSAVQILFVSISLSDVSKILRPADAHGWGEQLLQPLPVALNSASSLRTGEHGLQQRIAPQYAGQQTLEMAKPKTEKEKKRAKKNYQMPPP